LDRHEPIADHVLGRFGGFFAAANQLNSALGWNFDEGTLASATGMDLGFDHCKRSAELVECCLSLLGSLGNMPLKDGNLEGAKQLFRLILVDFHRVILSGGLKVMSDVEMGVARRIRAFAT
jgi:hypothetical protein